MNKLPDWAVVGAEIVTNYLSLETIVRVTETSAWTISVGDQKGYQTRWISHFDDGLRIPGSSHWDRRYGYNVNSPRGKVMKREALLKKREQKIAQASKRIGVRVNGVQNLDTLAEAAITLREEAARYLLLIQAIQVEEAEDKARES